MALSTRNPTWPGSAWMASTTCAAATRREWDERLDRVKIVVVVEAQPVGVKMATALARRGIETHLVDPHPWPMAEIADPDIMEPVEESSRELGVEVHFEHADRGTGW